MLLPSLNKDFTYLLTYLTNAGNPVVVVQFLYRFKSKISVAVSNTKVIFIKRHTHLITISMAMSWSCHFIVVTQRDNTGNFHRKVYLMLHHLAGTTIHVPVAN